MLEGIVFVGLHTEVLQHNCNHFSDEAARENPTAWASKIFWNFHPRSLGRWSHLTNIFEMGWFNHQLDKVTTPTNRRKVFLVSTIFTIGEQGLTNLRNWFWPKSNLERWWFCKNFEVDKSVVAMVSPWRRGLMLFRNCQVSMFLLNKHIPDEAKGRADSVGFADVSWLFSKSSIFFCWVMKQKSFAHIFFCLSLLYLWKFQTSKVSLAIGPSIWKVRLQPLQFTQSLAAQALRRWPSLLGFVEVMHVYYGKKPINQLIQWIINSWN